MSSTDIQLSKYLSWLLRHGAVKEGLSVSPEGYVDVNQIVQRKRFRDKFNISDIERVVATDNKKRYKLRVNPESQALEIKANQGHSLDINNCDLVQILEPKYDTVIHGTYLSCWPQIKVQGLSRMQRQHIHFAKSTLSDTSVVSGVRFNVTVYIYINLKKALDDGIKFFESENNVILTPGNDKGFLEPKYFKKVIKVGTGM